ncbi:AraC-type DNA-binding protein [Granulicatella balaenopterae]|uniref:AraC-type DNA-binding protein n=1 Tax=Granulicatella balaenopterae TaxID=137733 RepID=A0A1H9LTN9_9LACT|nr:AraC family transcriptional regulator [Granulicatella balaenopterae]SER14831.1 AraC-type DNA-binding protein [Granulicatella balaenopterae]
MFTKTSAILKNKYFHTIQKWYHKKNYVELHKVVTKKKIKEFYCYEHPIYLRAISGIVMIIVTDNPTHIKNENQFILHGAIKIHAGVHFNFISVSQSCELCLSLPKDSQKKVYSLPKPVQMMKNKEELHLSEIYATYYQIKRENYFYPSESHPYCELTIVENGELITTVDGVSYTLKKHDVMLYQRNQIHTQAVKKEGVTTYITIMLELDTNDDRFFNRIFHMNAQNLMQIEKFVAISSQQNIAYKNDQLLAQLKLFIISLLEKDNTHYEIPHTSMKEKYDNDIFVRVCDYIRKNPQVKVADLVQIFGLSRSSLQTLFHHFTNGTPKQYIEQQRIKQAKILMKELTYSIEEIAYMVGYNSLPSFSRAFKQATKQSPSQFAHSIYKRL